MNKIWFGRRKRLGAGSARGVSRWMNGTDAMPSVIFSEGETCGIVRNDRVHRMSFGEGDLLVRWGCTSNFGVPLSRQVNKPDGIHRVNDKRGMRKLLMQSDPDIIPHTIFDEWDYPNYVPFVVRPTHHAQGRHLKVVENLGELMDVINSHPFSNGWYASELIHKVDEVRVYVVQGRVATVARKTPDNPDAVAWNVAQGGRFDVVRWGEWPMEAIKVALRAFKHSGLDFSGVDVMIDDTGRAYVIELNSAPSLPALSDGSVSYRQACMAKTFKWMLEHGLDHMEADNYANWRGVIHPAIQEY